MDYIWQAMFTNSQLWLKGLERSVLVTPNEEASDQKIPSPECNWPRQQEQAAQPAFTEAKEDGGEEGLRSHSSDTGVIPGLSAWAEQSTFTQFVFVPKENTWGYFNNQLIYWTLDVPSPPREVDTLLEAGDGR